MINRFSDMNSFATDIYHISRFYLWVEGLKMIFMLHFYISWCILCSFHIWEEWKMGRGREISTNHLSTVTSCINHEGAWSHLLTGTWGANQQPVFWSSHQILFSVHHRFGSLSLHSWKPKAIIFISHDLLSTYEGARSLWQPSAIKLIT